MQDATRIMPVISSPHEKRQSCPKKVTSPKVTTGSRKLIPSDSTPPRTLEGYQRSDNATVDKTKPLDVPVYKLYYTLGLGDTKQQSKPIVGRKGS